MSRTLTVAGLLVDSWRDRSRQTEPGEMNPPPGSATSVSRLRGASDDVPLAPRLTSLIELGAVKWEPR